MVKDSLNRPLKDLRISVTDRCNFRCVYCMPLDTYEWVDREQILTFEEIARLAALFVRLGVQKIRLTGGEPLVRKGIDRLIESLSALPGLEDLTLTTNGSLLASQAAALRKAGLKRINVSLDTLDEDKFRRMTKWGDLGKVLEGLYVARAVGLHPIKINAVVQRGVNDDEVVALVEFSRQNGFAVRFIEYMDVGNVNGWQLGRMVSKQEMLEKIRAYSPVHEIGREEASDTAVRYRFTDGSADIGFIPSVTEPFCAGCTRARLTAEGKLVSCLFSQEGHDLRALLRGGSADEEIETLVRGVWRARSDRYSEERWNTIRSEREYRPEEHKKLEMISLGG
jgi:cyclic pyranopterin phosphate synthase